MNASRTLQATSRRAQIALLSAENVWPYLVVADAGTIGPMHQEGTVIHAIAAGRQAAQTIRRDHPGQSLGVIVNQLGVKVVESEESPRIAWRYRRSEYRGKPPRIIIYRQALLDLGGVAAKNELEGAFPAAGMRDLLLAHELYHHVAFTMLGRVSDHYRLPWIRLGPLTLRRREPALDEVAAHVFAQTLQDLPMSPAVLDWLTLYGDPRRLEAFMCRVERLVEIYRLDRSNHDAR